MFICALDVGSSGPCLRPGEGHCVVLLGRHISLSAVGVQMANLMLG